MNWKSLGKKVAQAAPLLGTALGGPAGAVVGQLLATAFDVDADPEQLETAILTDPDAIQKLKGLQAQHRVELAKLAMEHELEKLRTVNETIQEEYKQDDKYVKRWRPTFGYTVCATWFLQTVGIVVALGYAIIEQPGNAGDIINAVAAVCGALTVMWSIALSVLGVSVHSRSKDKEILAGLPDHRSIKEKIFGSK